MRENNFDIVRLTLAVSVLLSHAYSLSQSSSLLIFHQVLSGQAAVEGFFAISGFLIFASYERSRSLREYFSNRAWRILPGYWLSTVFCILIAFWFGEFHVGRFVLCNLLFANFLQDHVGAVFALNPGNSALNGALWTIKIEVMFYVAVPLIVLSYKRFRRDTLLWSLFVLSIVYRMALQHSHSAGMGKLEIQLPGQLSFFMIGALIQYHLAWFKHHGKWLALAAAGVHAIHLETGWFLLRPVSVPVLTLGACLLLPHFKGPARWGDFSYGTYILHYPIIQLVVAYGLFARNAWLALALVLVLVALGAVLSWFLIEKHALTHARSAKLRRAALGAAPNYPAAVP